MQNIWTDSKGNVNSKCLKYETWKKKELLKKAPRSQSVFEPKSMAFYKRGHRAGFTLFVI